jgi:hypothetical protein
MNVINVASAPFEVRADKTQNVDLNISFQNSTEFLSDV